MRCLPLRLAAVALTCVAVLAHAQPPASNDPPAPLLPTIEKAAQGLPAGGFVLAEVDHQHVTFAAAGNPAPHADVAPGKVVFEIGSITKVFTALLLAEAVNEHRAALTDPIAKFLPSDLKLAPATAAITLEQLATHTSGLPSLPTNFQPADPLDPYADYSLEKLYDFLRTWQPEHPAPQPADYSNLGFGLLGHLLERIYAQPYAKLIHDRITSPLGLSDTVIALDPGQTARFALPYSGSEAVKPWRLDALAGAGALRSTAADLAKFAQALLTPADTPLYAAWKLIREPRVPFGTRGSHLGLAIMIATRNGETVYNHSGGTGGFRSYLELVPATGRATVLWLNNDTLEPALLVAQVRRPPAPAPTPVASSTPPPTLTTAELATFTGVYVIDNRARFTAVLGPEQQLELRLTGQPFIPVHAIAPDRFAASVVAAQFEFTRDHAGHIDGVVLHQNGHTVPARRTDEPTPHVIFLSPDKLGEYLGHYQLTSAAVFDVTTRAGHLFVKLTGQPAFPVFCTAPDEFVYDVVPAALTFERDANGSVTAVVLHQNGRDQRAPRVKD